MYHVRKENLPFVGAKPTNKARERGAVHRQGPQRTPRIVEGSITKPCSSKRRKKRR